ncbi:pyrroline-5-carboxylate reductase [Spiroplasma tabanidicola]|uniref:Pyrroline-5-carboxylate reductase n=2 Tax=Spiroplasma tabanidicola TaxID=324079 RepID=A0A6I6CC47_9MOLU|nr:pyrroline-5-carboxylate reductase [Spiroplasma tabanidicola]
MIGTGHMGEAILKALSIKLEKTKYKMFILNRNEQKSQNLANLYKCNYLDYKQVINFNQFDIFILGFRPSDAKNFFKTFKLNDQKNKLIISMLNAYTIDTIKLNFENNINIVRIMPNMNASECKSSTGYVTYGVNKNLINIGIDIIKYFGKAYELEESNFSGFVALTGCAPAFIYEFINGFKEFAKECGYDLKQANEFIKDTIVATTNFALSEEYKLDDLINKIIVPGGPTEAGHNVLIHNNFKDILIKCFEASKEKS